MKKTEFANLSPEQFRKYAQQHKEKDWLLIDVRQPAEYEKKHIPGALLIPVSELQSRVFELPSDRDLLFYCHSGGRSAFAADMVSDAEVTEKKIWNLAGGIMAWDGKTLADFPKIAVFPKTDALPELLMTAMNLEKGAFRFYQYALEKFSREPFARTLADLSKAEEAHAELVYRYWEKTQSLPLPFEKLFADLGGEILEGGEKLETVIIRLEKAGGSPCISVMELALHIEYTAYDLYRTVAEQSGNDEAKEIFLGIAQAEKGHMKMLVKSLSECS
ncbi:MAG: rhodanese-like domain-containing protein [Desulfococcaceae bacterium]